MEKYSLDFEKPIRELERKIEELQGLGRREGIDFDEEIRGLESRLTKLQDDTFNHLTPWQKVQLARHPNRPKCLTLVELMFDEFLLLHGDRLYSDDQAVVGGLARVEERKIVMRNLRHEAMDELKGLEKNKDISQDELKRALDQLQKLTDSFIADTDQIGRDKEVELTKV